MSGFLRWRYPYRIIVCRGATDIEGSLTDRVILPRDRGMNDSALCCDG